MDMNVAEHTSNDESTHGGGVNPPCTGLTPDALPEVQQPVSAENSPTGVSTKNVLLGRLIKRVRSASYWYVLRCAYGQEKKAYDYIVQNKGVAYYPTVRKMKMVDGKRITVEESRLRNLLFIYGTEEEVNAFVYDNVHLPFLRYYYRYLHIGNIVEKKPLIVPDDQMASFRIICEANAKDIIITSDELSKFSVGQSVRVTDGVFAGVTGRVARYRGQQRVGVVMDGVLTAVTAYIPTGFLEVQD